MNEIKAEAKNLSSLLKAKFTIDYYQREYRWKEEQVKGLINDLTERFEECYKQGNELSAIKGSSHYFLGSIIICNKEGQQFIIDGQQRLTTLTLLLIHIYRLLGNDEEQLTQLIFTKQDGQRLFHIDIPERKERKECMDELLDNNNFEENGEFKSVEDIKNSLKDEAKQSESVVNIIDRFKDVIELFPYKSNDGRLRHFVVWLKKNAHLVVITPPSDADAYIIFETMNDRGLSLTPTEMLKAYILANIEDSTRQREANQLWQKQVDDLQRLGRIHNTRKEEDADAIRAWLHSRYADTIRERKRDAVPLDFDLINTELHRWVRDNKEDLKLNVSDDFARFIEEDFEFYSRWYYHLRVAAIAEKGMEKGLEAVHYCADFTLQYPVLLAPLRREDSPQDIMQKLRITSAYLDILITRLIWNGRTIDKYTMFKTMLLIRDKKPKDLVDLLTKRFGGLSIILCNFIFNIKSALIFYRKSVHRRYPIS